ncbi:MAG: YkgJ family cysteine cluster protein [Deltaproteobacteria bacterium]|nr:YkgJ family cysteine cluster protein [Deltaproteobacteria bacterium]MBN2686668.1 YkgJ family cysteine cluster protein [Deltaproteobacteria bacterium]
MKYDSDKECRRCGTCSLANLIAFVTDEDKIGWKGEQRQDILRVLDNWDGLWAGDRLVSRTDGRQLYGCPFLKWEKNHYTCTIYETRPEVCRNYLPGSSHICPYYREGKISK